MQVIGNGDAFGAGGHYHSCFYLESTETKFLVDLGATAIHNLHSKIDFNEIDLIIISHFHGDHIGGIPFFLLESTFLTERQKPLTIVGPKDCKKRIIELTEAHYKGVTKKFNSFELTFIEYGPKMPIKIGDLQIIALPAIHSPQSNPHCLRITAGDNSFAYSGDTEWTNALYEISKGVDYFVCECTYFSTLMEGHLTYMQDHEKLAKIEAKKVVLTHMGGEMLEEINKSKVSIEFSEENKIYKL